jgi:mannose-1-phosphate guanylyltransferase
MQGGIMKAVILVGGKATRLLPLTANTPKAMVPVVNIPFLESVMINLKKSGVDHVILAQSHLAQPIRDYFGDGRRFNIRIDYVVEANPLGTAGAVKNCEIYLDRPFLVLNGDIFTDLDMAQLVRYHDSNHALATIALTPVADPTSYGLIETHSRGRVTRFLEKPTWDQVTTNMINAGTYVLEPEVLGFIPFQTNFSFERELFPLLLKQMEPLYAYPSPAYWMDIGTPAKYQQLHRDILQGKVSHPGFILSRKTTIGAGSRLHETVVAEGPVVIGDRCSIGKNVYLEGPLVLGPDCVIEDGATIKDSVTWYGTKIEASSYVTGSLVANQCTLKNGCRLENVILGDRVTVSPYVIVPPQSNVEPGTIVA